MERPTDIRAAADIALA